MALIGIDASRALVEIRTGTETYSSEVLRAMRDLDTDDAITCYVNSVESDDRLDLPGTVKCIPSRRFWTINALSREMRRSPPDVLFVPAHTIPPRHPASVVTIHDLGFHLAPEGFAPQERVSLEAATRWNVRAATSIIAVSQQTKIDLISRYGLDADKMHVIHHGVDQRFHPMSAATVQSLRNSLGLRAPFLLAVGTLHPRKNLARLVSSFELAAAAGLEHDLVIAGTSGPSRQPLLDRIASSPYSSRIRMTGHVDSDNLPSLYAAADMTLVVSLYEGFGMTAVESMACGTPVIASSTGALPEICGPAAAFVDPLGIEGITSQILRVANNVSLRRSMINQGIARAQTFTWKRCAEETLEVLRHVRDAA